MLRCGFRFRGRGYARRRLQIIPNGFFMEQPTSFVWGPAAAALRASPSLAIVELMADTRRHAKDQETTRAQSARVKARAWQVGHARVCSANLVRHLRVTNYTHSFLPKLFRATQHRCGSHMDLRRLSQSNATCYKSASSNMRRALSHP